MLRILNGILLFILFIWALLEQKKVNHKEKKMGKSEKGFVPALILCILLGGFGAHRFYVGKPLTAILMILTFSFNK